MALEGRLARELVREHPERAVGVLERLSVEQGARVLGQVTPHEAAELVERLSPQRAADLLDKLASERITEVLEVLRPGVASRLLRRLDEARREAVLEGLPARVSRGIRALIQFPEHSAGALMDPNVLALPESLSAREALERVRAAPDQARYNIYVVDAEQKLVGVVNLRELFIARPSALLRDLMVRSPLRLAARADRAAVISHPGWKEVHALPVVDENGCYLGAIRYRTLRQLEALLLRGAGADADVQEALGDLLAVGAGALVDALTAARPRREEG